MIDVLAETLQKLTARRGLVARELATLDEAIAALQRVRDEAPKHGTEAARPFQIRPLSERAPALGPPPAPRLCALESCGKVLPPPVREHGRPRIYYDTRCKHRALKQRQGVTPPPPPPSHCGAKACGKVLPPPVRPSGRPRLYCNDTCSRRAFEERKAPQPPPVSASPRQPGRGSKWAQGTTAAVDDEDPTDRAIRMHKELHPVPESASGMRSRAKGRA